MMAFCLAVGAPAHAVVAHGFLSGITQSPGSFVRPMARQPNDQILVGGNFTALDDQKNLVRLRGDGSTDTSYEGAEVNGSVHSIVELSSSQILIAGSFPKVYSIYPWVPIATRNGLVLMDSYGYVNTYFNPDATANGSQGNVFRALRLASGTLLVGGHFTGIDGTARSKLVRLNSNGSVDTTFNADTMNINDYVWNNRPGNL